MDSLDIAILRVMGLRPFVRWPRRDHGVRPAIIAHALDEHEQTVRDRIARMEADSVIRGYHLMPNMRHVGQDVMSIHWELGTSANDDTITRLRAVDGVLAALRFYDSHICFDVSYESPSQRDRRLDVIGHLLGEDREVLWSLDIPFPPLNRELSTLDWRILEARRTDARRPATEVAEAVGVTAKTVRARYEAMRADGSVDEYVSVDYAAMTDAVPFILYVWAVTDDPDPTEELLAQFDAHLLNHFRATDPRSGLFVLHLVASNPAEVQRFTDVAGAIDGVERVEPHLPTGGFWNEALLDEIVAGRARLETA